MEVRGRHDKPLAHLTASPESTQPAHQVTSADTRTRTETRARTPRKRPSSGGTTVVGIRPQIPVAGPDAVASTVHRRNCIPTSASLSWRNRGTENPSSKPAGNDGAHPSCSGGRATHTPVGRTAFMFQDTRDGVSRPAQTPHRSGREGHNGRKR